MVLRARSWRQLRAFRVRGTIMRLVEGSPPRRVEGPSWGEDVRHGMFMRPLSGADDLPAYWREAFDGAYRRFDGQPFRLTVVQRTTHGGMDYLAVFFETDWKAVQAARRLPEGD